MGVVRLSRGYGRLSDGCGEAVWGGHLEVLGRLSGGCGEAVWRAWESYLEGVGRLS